MCGWAKWWDRGAQAERLAEERHREQERMAEQRRRERQAEVRRLVIALIDAGQRFVDFLVRELPGKTEVKGTAAERMHLVGGTDRLLWDCYLRTVELRTVAGQEVIDAARAFYEFQREALGWFRDDELRLPVASGKKLAAMEKPWYGHADKLITAA